MSINSNIEEIWNLALVEYLKEELGPTIYMEYFECLKPISYENGIFILQAPTMLHKNILESKFEVLVLNALKFYINTDKTLKVKFVTANSNDGVVHIEENESLATTYEESKTVSSPIPFNPKYTFENFVIGENNRFAHAASLAVADSPGQRYNPLFIYGGVGLGKTHLMHAIAQRILNNNPTKRVVYTFTNEFVNEFVTSIKNGTDIQFRNKYKNVDILLIDDIQFLSGKESTQDEFFNIFNELHMNNKQIILTSDRPPNEIKKLKDRLSTRFNWGIITDISSPDFETRCAILEQKCEEENIILDEQIITYIAQNLKSNIRDLEGALLKLKALKELMGTNLTLDVVKNNLKDIISIKNKKITLDEITNYICEYYNVKKEDIFSSRRTKDIAHSRQIIMYLSRELTDNSLPFIGSFLGGKDHSTIIHGYDKIKSEIKENKNFKEEIDRIINELNVAK